MVELAKRRTHLRRTMVDEHPVDQFEVNHSAVI